MAELTRDELEALVGSKDGYIFEPPDECGHGFSPPSRCPNEGCMDQHVASAWYKLRAQLNALPALPVEEKETNG